MAHEFAIASLRAKKARTDRTNCHRMANNLLNELLCMCKNKTRKITKSVENVQTSTENVQTSTEYQGISEITIENVNEIPSGVILVSKSSQTNPKPTDIDITVKPEVSNVTFDQKKSTESIQKETDIAKETLRKKQTTGKETKENWQELIDKVRKQIKEYMREVCEEKPYCSGHSESASSVYQENRLHYKSFQTKGCVRKRKYCCVRVPGRCCHKPNSSKNMPKRKKSKLICTRIKSCVDKSQKPSSKLCSSDEFFPKTQSLLMTPVACWCCSPCEKNQIGENKTGY